MALIDITPIMTSNTTPAPYVVSESSVNPNAATTDLGYKAFDKDKSDSVRVFWHSNSGYNQWLKIDYGSQIRISAFSITAHTVDGAPKDFMLLGSNDDKLYEPIAVISGETNWVKLMPNMYKLSKDYTFRYYKLITSAGNGYGYIIIREMNFYQEDGTDNEIQNIKNTSRLYCLPSNNTLAIKQRINDSRKGLLGYADDPYNYGTLYMIDNTGKSIIPKAAMVNSDLLFEGNSGVIIGSVVTLTNTINEYQFIYFDVSWDSTTTTSFYVNVDSLISKINTNSNSRHLMLSIHADYYLGLTFNADYKSFYIQTKSTNTGNTLGVTKVLGIK